MTPPAERLAARITAQIARDGPIPLADFMSAALVDPEFGYYTRRDPLGERGDFVTAPEISQMVGEMVALWFLALWEAMGGPARVTLVELGPGRGTLMADLLRAARIRPAFAAALELRLVESSPVLRDIQQRALAGRGAAWHETFAEAAAAAKDGPLFVIANEFFDALPIHQLVRTKDGWRERLVDNAGGGGFRFVAAKSVSEIASRVPDGVRDAPAGSVLELRPAAAAIAGDVARHVAARRGAALILDYGYLGPATGDTLQALRRHRRHEPLADPGEADITAHVDFGTLGNAARAAGALVFGPAGQGDFLRRLGIETRAERLAAANPDRRGEIGAALSRLIGDDGMGNLFKVLALTDPGQRTPPGFS